MIRESYKDFRRMSSPPHPRNNEASLNALKKFFKKSQKFLYHGSTLIIFPRSNSKIYKSMNNLMYIQNIEYFQWQNWAIIYRVHKHSTLWSIKVHGLIIVFGDKRVHTSMQIIILNRIRQTRRFSDQYNSSFSENSAKFVIWELALVDKEGQW